ncbi:DUF7557 family protein [Methanoculleus bovis]
MRVAGGHSPTSGPGTREGPAGDRTTSPIQTFIRQTEAYLNRPSTTIKIDTELKGRLNVLKVHPQESYSEGIRRLVAIAVDEEPLSEETIRELSNGRLRILRPGESGESTLWMRSWRS